jgi:hypothetical protein
MKVGQTVDVYENINQSKKLKKKVYSIRDSKTKKVIAHVEEISLVDCTYHVSESGRQRVIKQKRKNVHAYIRGRVSAAYLTNPIKAKYNPYLWGYFYIESRGTKIVESKIAHLTSGGLYVELSA